MSVKTDKQIDIRETLDGFEEEMVDGVQVSGYRLGG